MRHVVAGFALTLLARVFGLSQAQGAGFGAVAVTSYELYQGVTHSGTPQWKDVRQGLAGVALISIIPDRKTPATVLDLNLARIRFALRAECDSVSRKQKRLDDSLANFARRVCPAIQRRTP